MNGRIFILNREAILKFNRLITGFILGALMAAFTQASAEEDNSEQGWQFTANLYVWGQSIGGESSSGEDIDISFSDIWENLNFAMMTWLVARNGNWLVFGDIQYADIEGDDNTDIDPGDGMTIPGELDLEFTQWVVQTGGGYTISKSNKHVFDVIAGVRYIHQDAEIKLDIGMPQKLKTDETADNIDAIIGVHSLLRLNDKWYLQSYADIGTGESDFTWQGMASLGYQFNSFDALLGYRHIYWDFDGNKGLGKLYKDLDFSGPQVGAAFRF
jgi:hypothetical protein